MAQRIVIDPVTRIEGHAKITIHLDDAGQVSDAHFHVTEFRGFERFCEGRPFWEMAGITARICGICPVSHLMASAKAGDQILAVRIPPAAEKLRRLMNLAQIIQSHALSFFHLSAPDLLLGMDSDPARRNVFGLIAAEPELARGGIRLRQFGQEIIAALGGQKIHPAWSVPGGVRVRHCRIEDRDCDSRSASPSRAAPSSTRSAASRDCSTSIAQEAETFGNFPTLFLGLVAADGDLGALRRQAPLRGRRGQDRRRRHRPEPLPRVHRRGGRAVVVPEVALLPAARLSRRHLPRRPAGPAQPLQRMGTPLADRELAEFRQLGGGAVNSVVLSTTTPG